MFPEAAAELGERGRRPLKSRCQVMGAFTRALVQRMGKREKSQEIFMTSAPSTVRKPSDMQQLKRLDNML